MPPSATVIRLPGPRPQIPWSGLRVRRLLTEGGRHHIKSGLSKWRDGRDLLAIGGLCGPFHTMVNLM